MNGYYLDQNDTTVCLGDSLDLSVILSSTFLNVPGNGATDIDGNTYSSVFIGNQEWMGENLKTTKYANGSSIPNITSNSAWQTLTGGAWCYWGNSSANNTVYGKLYNWYVASDSQNVCPTNWHVPSQAEAFTMINYLGGISVAGGKIKEIGTTHWKTPNTGATNSSGFTALPGGYRDDWDGGFYTIGNGGSGTGVTNNNSIGRHWTSSPADSSNNVNWPDHAYEFGVHQAQNSMNSYVYGIDRNWGVSIRCLKDFIPTSYNWSTGDTLASITVSPSQTTTYYVTISSAAGNCMDSVTVYIHPKILNAGLDQSTCQGDSVTLTATGGTSYSWNNSVSDGLPFSPLTTDDYVVSGIDTAGCTDSDTITVTVNSVSTGVDMQTVCDSYTWIDGNTYTVSNNTAQWILTNIAGCDSLVTLDLTIIPLPDNSVTQNGTVLSANQIGATYQWLDCDNGNGVIAAETNQIYTPNVTGNYAVEVTLNGCTNTSACYLVDYTGLSDLYNEILSIRPNPAKDVLFIDGINEINGFNYIEVISLAGEIIEKFETAKEEINVSNYPSGEYFLNVSHLKGVESLRFVKQ
jgi:uncharacterized protein (TIGR02145 family)